MGVHAPARVRWGAGDLVWVLLAQLAGTIVAELVYRSINGIPVEETVSTSAFFWAVLPAGSVASAAAIVVISRRKGSGSLRHDFGLEVRTSDWTALPAGVGWQVVLILLLVPFALLLDSDEPAQELIEDIEEARSVGLWIAIVAQVAVIQPAIEEVMFRGILLRSLLRRWTPAAAVVGSGLIFGAVHVTGTGFDRQAIPTIVGLSAFGMILALLALRHGSLSRPILTHMGFNLAVLALSAGAPS